MLPSGTVKSNSYRSVHVSRQARHVQLTKTVGNRLAYFREICGDLQSHPHGAFVGRFIVSPSIRRYSRQCDCQHFSIKLSPFLRGLFDDRKTLMIDLQVGIPLVADFLDSDVFLFHPGHEVFFNCFHGSTAPIGIDILCYSISRKSSITCKAADVDANFDSSALRNRNDVAEQSQRPSWTPCIDFGRLQLRQTAVPFSRAFRSALS